MAERATAEGVARDMKPPQYRQAVQKLRTIKPKKDRISSINGEISGIYDSIEGYKVNKKAARIFMTLDGLEADEQTDIFRSLQGLIDAAGWAKGDLVDQAEGGQGNIVTPDFGGRRAAAESGETGLPESEVDALVGELEKPAGDPQPEPEAVAAPATDKPKAKRPSPAEARQRAKEHFGEGKAPPASGEPAPEPYTGDNADLAGE